VVRDGTFGLLPPEVATPLALVLVELVQNAVEHGLGGRDGTVGVLVRRGAGLRVEVHDDGAGLPAGFGPGTEGLGLQIVRTLVEGELGGSLALLEGGPGTRAVVDLPLADPPAG
jgi:two-component system, sensor histidine kinase PdtaS